MPTIGVNLIGDLFEFLEKGEIEEYERRKEYILNWGDQLQVMGCELIILFFMDKIRILYIPYEESGTIESFVDAEGFATTFDYFVPFVKVTNKAY